LTLFGRTLEGQEIATLVFMLLALVFWIIVWRGERRDARWFKAWNAGRKARRDAEAAARKGGSGDPRGPWG
jgi:hypothetical protein